MKSGNMNNLIKNMEWRRIKGWNEGKAEQRIEKDISIKDFEQRTRQERRTKNLERQNFAEWGRSEKYRRKEEGTNNRRKEKNRNIEISRNLADREQSMWVHVERKDGVIWCLWTVSDWKIYT